MTALLLVGLLVLVVADALWLVRAVRTDGAAWRRPPRHVEAHWTADGLPSQPYATAG